MRKHFKGQATIELIVVFPLALFFIYVLFLNGYKVFSLLANTNTNYSEGMSIVRRPSQDKLLVDLVTADSVLQKNMRGATLGENTVSVVNMQASPEWALNWGGRVLSTQVNPPSSLWDKFVARAGASNKILQTVLTYAASPFISYFPK